VRTLGILKTQKESLGIKRNISVKLCPLITGSIVAGFAKPAIMLQTTQYSDEELSFIVRHKLIHFKRKDLFFKILVLTAKAIHWFNPVIYLIVKTVSAQCEKACDDAVIGNADITARKKYALFIADIAKTQSGIQTALTTNFYGGKYNMKNRLLSIIDKNKKKKGIILICFALILTICTSFAIAANAYAPENSQSADLSKISAVDTSNDTLNVGTTTEEEVPHYRTTSDYQLINEEAAGLLNSVETEDILLTYDTYKEYIENTVKPQLQTQLGKMYYLNDEGPFVWTQEEIDAKIANYYSTLEEVKNGTAKVTVSYVKGTDKIASIQTVSTNPSQIKRGISQFTYNASDGMRFSADTYESLYGIVKNYFDEQVKAGKMTQEEANSKLSEMSENNTVMIVK